MTPIAHALSILRDQSEGTEKYLIIGSDFLQDRGKNKAGRILDFDQHVTAEGVNVLLVFTAPKPEYLAQFHLSEAELYRSLVRWVGYFQSRGAADVAYKTVDALAAQAMPVGGSN